MHRFALAAGLLALAVSGSSRADEKDVAKALKALEGTYVIAGIEGEGIKLSEDDIKKFIPETERKVTIKGNQIIAQKGGKEDPATMKIDPTKKPAVMDISSKENGKDETSYGIYKLEGTTLTICTVEKGAEKDRPTAFKAGGKTILLTLKKLPAK